MFEGQFRRSHEGLPKSQKNESGLPTIRIRMMGVVAVNIRQRCSENEPGLIKPVSPKSYLFYIPNVTYQKCEKYAHRLSGRREEIECAVG